MKTRRILFVTTFIGMVLACGPMHILPTPTLDHTVDAYHEAVNSWVGTDANLIVQKWGIPDKEFKLPNGNVIWHYQDEIFSFSYTLNLDWQEHEYSKKFECKTEFEIENSIIIRTFFSGNSCFHIEEPEGLECLNPGYPVTIDMYNSDGGFVLLGNTDTIEIEKWSTRLEVTQETAESKKPLPLMSQETIEDALGKRAALCLNSPFGPYVMSAQNHNVILLNKFESILEEK